MKKLLLLLAIISLFVSCEKTELNEFYQIDKEDVIPPGERGEQTTSSEEIDKDDVIPPGERE